MFAAIKIPAAMAIEVAIKRNDVALVPGSSFNLDLNRFFIFIFFLLFGEPTFIKIKFQNLLSDFDL
jgi:hypothetical protein